MCVWIIVIIFDFLGNVMVGKKDVLFINVCVSLVVYFFIVMLCFLFFVFVWRDGCGKLGIYGDFLNFVSLDL